VQTYEGHWAVYPHKIEFTIECEQYIEEELSIQSIEISSVQHSLDNVTDEINLKDFILKEVLVYVDDTSLEPLIRDVLHRMPGGKEMSVYRQLNGADMKIHSVMFVQSVAACLAAKQKKYKGHLVLLSERLNYLDNNETLIFDYAVSLPCSMEDMNSLLYWLRALCLKQTEIKAEEKLDENNRINQEVKVKPTLQKRDLTFSLSSGPILIPNERLESYTKWRVFNPAGLILHQSMTLNMFIVPSCIGYLLLWYLKIFNLRTFLINGLLCFVSLHLRYNIYYFVNKCIPIRFDRWWYG
jgi:hypothetical protein